MGGEGNKQSVRFYLKIFNFLQKEQYHFKSKGRDKVGERGEE